MMTGMWALYAREVKRFQKILLDTVFSPLVSVLMYLGVFGVVAGSRTIGEGPHALPYITFVYVGLLGMMMVNSSFSNPSFALIIAKNVGNIIDLQLVPIKAWKVGIAYACAALTRGLFTLVVAILATAWFIPGLGIHSFVYLILALVLTGLEFGMLGVTFGFWAKNFEALTFMTTFIMQPMIFLAGVFFPIATLPAPWATISQFNPIHHNINLLRYAVTGYSDTNPIVSLGVVVGMSVVLFGIMQVVTRKNLRV
ncbi:MAG: ABC transporter permease [Candidatus Magasanikbacteria bacterium]|nr:ABC transporter permease [Candidatus Magasanikbacteria bacterium]